MSDIKARLLAERFSVEEIEVPGIGTVKVRGLTRGEVLEFNDRKLSEVEGERFMLAKALVEPKMTEEDIAQWQAVSPPNEIGAVVEGVLRLSGLNKDAQKAAYKSAE